MDNQQVETLDALEALPVGTVAQPARYRFPIIKVRGSHDVVQDDDGNDVVLHDRWEGPSMGFHSSERLILEGLTPLTIFAPPYVAPTDAALVTGLVRTRHPANYVLHNTQDGTRWRLGEDGYWQAVPVVDTQRAAAHGAAVGESYAYMRDLYGDKAATLSQRDLALIGASVDAVLRIVQADTTTEELTR